MPEEPAAYGLLRVAFAALEADGLLTRMSYGCCIVCALDDIVREPGAETARGYVFFHRGDTEAVSSGTLRLAFGSLRPAEDLPPQLLSDSQAPLDSFERATAREEVWALSTVEIGEDVVRTLRRTGLRVDWDGAARTRISVAV